MLNSNYKITKQLIVKYFFYLSILFFSVTARAQLSADFTTTTGTTNCIGLYVQFKDLSLGNPTFWTWDLGNGTISHVKNPGVIYLTPGLYTIKLTIYNNFGDSSVITKPQYINIHDVPGVAFSGTPLTGCFPLPVKFTDLSSAGSGTITSWQWDFGDGSTSTQQSPSNTYKTNGNFNVTLNLVNSFGCKSFNTKIAYVKISDGTIANFTYTATNSCSLPVIITFQNTSTGTGLLNYFWDFGDGTTSTSNSSQSPFIAHTYTTAGSFSVKLISTTVNGCSDSIVKNSFINIGSIKAGFTYSGSQCVNSTIQFKNTSSPIPIAADWDFGDGTSSTLLQPPKIYSTPGTYTVRLISNFGGCFDTAYKNITILDFPKPDFTVPNSSNCTAPFTVNFTNITVGGTTYFWNFGDGSTSTNINPSHTYLSTGVYDVTLIATNANGCSNTLVKPGFIKIQPPLLTINNIPHGGCSPVVWTFSSTLNSSDSIINYHWDFGDGFTSTLKNPTHTFVATGSYTIKLFITTSSGCVDSAVVGGGIFIGPKPMPNFVATPTIACAKTNIFFTDLSTGVDAFSYYHWDFGDGSTSSLKNPKHAYNDTGYQTVTLTVCNSGCCDSIKFYNYIYIKPPIAIFSSSFICGNPFSRTFIDQSIGADSWLWDFGDGSTSTFQNPIHIYATGGKYYVTLTVVNNATGCDHNITNIVDIIAEKANFKALDTVVCKNTIVNFSSLGIDTTNIFAFKWFFGDGDSSTYSITNHSYKNAGKYDIKLIITDSNFCADTLLKPLYIFVTGPTGNFTSASNGNCLLNAVSFADKSIDSAATITNWIWDYGDGIIDTLTSPPFSHLYTSAGIYTVSLKVIDSKGCVDTYTDTTALVVSKPIAFFSTNDSISCPNKLVQFNNNSTGPGLSYFWSFGDGFSSNLQNPSHFFANTGLYTVKLLVLDKYGCADSLLKSINIVFSRSQFTVSDSVRSCPPLFVQFTSTPINYGTTIWDFGDGTSTQNANPSHQYTIPGTYYAKLIVISPGGCTDTTKQKIIVHGPTGSFTYAPLSGCVPNTVNFSATTNYNYSFIWDFADGNTFYTRDSNVSHVYLIPANYVPRIELIDSVGCAVLFQGKDTIKLLGAFVNYTFNKRIFCDTASITFSNTSIINDSVTHYFWEFGDGQTSTLPSPTHSYLNPGLYYPRLTISTKTGCVDSSKKPIPVAIYKTPTIDFNAPGNGCVPLTVNLAGQLLIPDTSAIAWNWNFGNGTSSTLQNPPSPVYDTAGIYTINLTGANDGGCIGVATKIIDVFPQPINLVTPDSFVCRGNGINLNVSSIGGVTYNWSPSKGLSCINCTSPFAKPDSITTYKVTSTSIHGCIKIDSININVIQRFVMSSSPNKELCIGSSVKLFANGAVYYNWTPTTGLSNSKFPTPTANPTITTNYMVIGNDEKYCFSDTGFVTVKVFQLPTVNAGPDQTISVGKLADLIPTLSSDVTSVVWTPTQSIVANNYPSIKVLPNQTTTYNIEALSIAGCKSSDQVTVFVICDGANVYIPNTFSPNGDGVNDVFFPRGTGLFRIKSVRIFNRWGEIVFQNNNSFPNDASAGWNGTFKGKKLTPDVYVYTMEIICSNQTVLTYKGNVALIE